VYQCTRQARVHIGIPTYNGAQRTEWLVRSLERAGGLPSRDVAITILDDGSPRAQELPALLALSQRYGLNLLSHPKNTGITQGWNDIIGFVDSELVVLLNDDVLLTPKWLDHLVYFLDNNACGGASPNLFFHTPEDVPDLLAGRPVTPRDPYTKVPNPNYPGYPIDPEDYPKVAIASSGSGFGFHRSTYTAVGGFDERLRNSHTEIWFGTAMAQIDRPSFVLTDRIWHLWSASFRENPELHAGLSKDGDTFMAKWGPDSSKYMVGMCGIEGEPARGMRRVKWLDTNDRPREGPLNAPGTLL
jgi:GT2 family glycosyltransferase